MNGKHTRQKEAEPRQKAGIIAGAVLVLVIAAVLVYGFVLTRTGYWLLAKFTPTPRAADELHLPPATPSARSRRRASSSCRTTTACSPLSGGPEKTKINLFGIRSIQMVYNGGGSAASDGPAASVWRTR